MPPPFNTLLKQCQGYVLGTWSKSCVMVDQQDEKGWIFDATNGNRRIRITVADCYSNTFVEVSNVNPYVIRFDGYIRTLKDFQLILELTSVKSPF